MIIQPLSITRYAITRYADDDDLLTGGLGKSGLESSTLPAIADTVAAEDRITVNNGAVFVPD